MTDMHYPQSVQQMLALFELDPHRVDVVLTTAVVVELARRLAAVEAVAESHARESCAPPPWHVP